MAEALPPFETFYEAQRGPIFRYLLRLCGNATTAEDHFQETFLRALRAYPRVEDPSGLRPWVYRIAHNVVVDSARATRRRPEAPLEAAGEPQAAAPRGGDPAAQGHLNDLTASLSPAERRAVVLRYEHDLSYAEIASVLECTPEAARAAASAGVKRLRVLTQKGELL